MGGILKHSTPPGCRDIKKGRCLMKQTFNVTGMSCSACSSHVEKSVSKLAGVQNASVNLLAASMKVDYNETNIIFQRYLPCSKACRLVASPVSGPDSASATKSIKSPAASQRAYYPRGKREKNMQFRLIVSFCFMIPLMYIAMGNMMGLPVPSIFIGEQNAVIFAFTQLLMTLPVIYVNRKYYINGYRMLFKGAPNMDTLIAVGSSAALIYGIFAIFKWLMGRGHNNIALVHQYMHDLYFESMILTLITLENI